MHSQPKAQKQVEDLRGVRAVPETLTSEIGLLNISSWARAEQLMFLYGLSAWWQTHRAMRMVLACTV